MKHAAEGTLQAFLDGELKDPEREAVETHLASCTECAAALDSLRRMNLEAREAVSLVNGRGFEIPDPAAFRRQHARSRTLARWIPGGLARAAMLAAVIAGVASAAIPGSPLRRWIENVFSPDVEAPVPVQVPVPETPTVNVPARPEVITSRENDIDVPLEAGRITVILTAPAPAVEIRVQLWDSAAARVRWSDQDARPRTGPGQFQISDVSEGIVEVRIPRVSRVATLVVDGAAWWIHQNSEVRVLGPSPRTRGDLTVFPPRS